MPNSTYDLNSNNLVRSINEKIAPFAIKGNLGEGGIGQIYMAEDPSGNATQAVKVLKENQIDKTLLKRFRLEYDLLNSLDHPCIAKVHEFHSGKVTFFTMEHIQGITLNEKFHIKKKGHVIKPEEIHSLIDVAFQSLEALHFLHTNHIIHRDLKPANIMIENNGQLKLLDLGVARHQESEMQLTQKQEIIGTFEYMAPEVLSGNVYDHRIDLYSLGVILYRILSGTRMFEVYSFLEMFKAKAKNESPLLSKEGLANFEWFVDLINKLTMKNAEDRYRTAAEAIKWIETYYNTGHILTRMHTPVSDLISPILAIRSAPLLGRADAIGDIKKWYEQPTGKPLIIHGTSGTGKSRILSFAAAEGRLKEKNVVQIDHNQYDQNAPFFKQVLNQILTSFYPEKPLLPVDQPENETWTVHTFNKQLAAHQIYGSFIFIVDDLHFISKDFLKELASSFQEEQEQTNPVFISWVFSYSDELEQGLILEEGISFLELLTDPTDVLLSPLTGEETEKMARFLLANTALSDALKEEIKIYSNGLPFSIAHFLSILISNQWLIRKDNKWTMSSRMKDKLAPASKGSRIGTDLVQKQLDALNEWSLDLIRTLSVLGDQTRVEIFESFELPDGITLEQTMSTLVLNQLLNYEGPMLSFPDHKIRERILLDLQPKQKKEYHAKALKLLENYYGFKHSRHFLEFLYHANLAEDVKKINQYSAGIAVFFFNRGMYEEGQQYFGNAIARSDSKSTFLHVEYYFWKAECELCLYRLQEAHSDYLMALKLLENIDLARSKTQELQVDRIQLIIAQKLMLLEYQRQRVGEAQNLQKRIRNINMRMADQVRFPKIDSMFNLAVNQWSDFQFPLWNQHNDPFNLKNAVFSTLMSIDHLGNFIPNMAKSWHWESKTRTLTFELKKNNFYHNGALIRSDDVLFSLDVLKKQKHYHVELTPPFKRIKSYFINEHGLIEIVYYTGPPPNMFFWAKLPIIPSYLYSHQIPEKAPSAKVATVGSGPYKIQNMTSKGWGLCKDKNSKATISNMQFFFKPNNALSHLKNGSFHLTQLNYTEWKNLVPANQVKYGVIRDQVVENKIFRLCFKLNRPGSLPLNLRRALYLCLPLENWNTLYLDNQFVVSRFKIIRTQSTEGQSKIKKMGSTEVFKALEEVGAYRDQNGNWYQNGEPFTIRILLVKDCILSRIFRAIVHKWRSLGIQVQISWRDYHQLGEFISHSKVDAWVDYIKLNASLEGLADYLHQGSISHGANQVGYISSEMNHLLTALQNSAVCRRKNLILRIEKIFEEELPWFPLYQPKIYYAYNASLGGLQPSSHGFFHSAWQFENLHSLT
ncbi:MAG: hypothetical protein CSA81_06940 [Acidobacteria bacterium]|nr:MAG: hypothetical protein CSA81_06940 [Acidobacteriota bacterium]